jgi:hypothetical protein
MRSILVIPLITTALSNASVQLRTRVPVPFVWTPLPAPRIATIRSASLMSRVVAAIRGEGTPPLRAIAIACGVLVLVISSTATSFIRAPPSILPLPVVTAKCHLQHFNIAASQLSVRCGGAWCFRFRVWLLERGSFCIRRWKFPGLVKELVEAF